MNFWCKILKDWRSETILVGVVRLASACIIACGGARSSSSLCSIARSGLNKLLNFVMVSLRLLDHQVAPIDCGDPANKVYRGQKLDYTNAQLSLVDVRVAEAGAQHGANTRQEDVENQTNVSIDDADLGDFSYKFPNAQILRVYLHHSLLEVLDIHVFTSDAESLRTLW